MSLNFNALSIIGGGSGGGSGAVSSAANTSSISTAITAGVISSTLLISTDAPPANTQGISNIISSAGSTGLLSYFQTGTLTEKTSSVLQITGLGSVVGATLAIQVNQASGTTSGFLSSTDWTTFNNKVDPTRVIGTTFPLLGGGDLSADRVLSMPIANGTTGGYLSAADWNTFNSKENAFAQNGITTSTVGVTIGNGISTIIGISAVTVDIQTASGSQPGLLSSTDWNTFNNKQSALSVGTFSYISFTQGATLFGSTLTIGWADATNPGSVGTTNQIFAGLKTFNDGIDLNSQKATSVLDPTNPQDAATKNYVDTVASALNPLQAVYAGSTVNIVGTYVNGVGGVGAQFTVTATGTFTIDGVTPPQGSRILFKNQSTGFQNGVYDLTNDGHLGVSPVLTRSLDYNQPSSINAGDLIPVINGTVNAVTSWLQTATVTTVGTDALVFVEWTANPASYLLKANNLSDVTNANTSLNNILPSQGGNSGDFLTTDGTNTSWAPVSSGGGSPNLGEVIENLGLTVTMAANAATITLTDASGSAPSGGSPVKVGFRDPTATVGTYNIRSIVSALTTVLADTDSGGTVSGAMGRIYIYLIDNAGTPELAWAGSNIFNENNLVNTIASGGLSTLYNVMYSTTARTGVPFRYIGYFESTQTVAGTWATAASLIGVYPHSPQKAWAEDKYDGGNGYGSTNTTVFKFSNQTSGSFNPSPTLFTVDNSATLGLSVTVNRRCRISFNLTMNYNQTSEYGISKNSTGLTTAIDALAKSQVVALAATCAANISDSCSTPAMIAKPGDIFRPQGNTASAGTGSSQSMFYIFAEEL